MYYIYYFRASVRPSVRPSFNLLLLYSTIFWLVLTLYELCTNQFELKYFMFLEAMVLPFIVDQRVNAVIYLPVYN